MTIHKHKQARYKYYLSIYHSAKYWRFIKVAIENGWYDLIDKRRR